ncbi:unnamed protein product [Tuber aestivum]|uniref:3-dehydrosphinganine reductase n=1 Tax=Tuber aestivum TaxID=59557 RepID=A0A292PJ31_9PEZI|nr:unnamed protein product [Tuber aestivum]
MPSLPQTTSAIALTAAIPIIYPFIMPLFSSNKLPVDGRLVAITGGSQGMGLSVAKLLASKGASVAIIARNKEKLDRAVGEIRESALREGQRFIAVSADLTIANEARRALEEIRAWGGVPDIVWTCAGEAFPGLFKDQDVQLLEKQVQTNYLSVLWTAHAALNIMTQSPLPPQSPERHLIFTSSVMAFYPLAGYNAYTPSKAAIRSLADGLRQECHLYNIAVHACFPGTIYSPGFEIEQLTKPEITKILEGSDEGQSPDEVAKQCVKRLEKGHALAVSSFMGETLRAASWGASPRGNWVWDTIFAWIINVVWLFMGPVMDSEVVKYRKKNGDEAFYSAP